MNPSFNLSLHIIRLTCEATTPIQFAAHAGAQWRGALWEMLSKFACNDPHQQNNSEHSWHCPMCFVLSLEAHGPRGINPARPLIIRPPLPIRAGEKLQFSPRSEFTLELGIVGAAVSVFPYLLQAIQRIGKQGIGYGRGRFTLNRVDAVNPLTKRSDCIYQEGSAIKLPTLELTNEKVLAYSETLSSDQLCLHFLTPTQLVQDGKILIKPDPKALIMRVLERLQSLESHYGQSESHDIWKARHETLSALATNVDIRRDETRWVRSYSGSQRAKRMQDISGFVGSIILEGDIAPLRLWLLWASLVNVGKNAIKGNGWFEISH